MADSCRGHLLIEAPIEEVWAVVSDPRTHPEWWPDVDGVVLDDPLAEGVSYQRIGAKVGFAQMIDSVWVVERLELLKEAHFRCTLSGAYTRFALTPAQDNTFVEVEAGILPTSPRWRAVKAVSPPFLKRWLHAMLDALPGVIAHGRAAELR